MRRRACGRLHRIKRVQPRHQRAVRQRRDQPGDQHRDILGGVLQRHIETAPVRRCGAALLEALSGFYGVPVPPLRVLGVRPHKVTAGVCTYQLFGDYTPSTQRIRVWMRTAIREKVSTSGRRTGWKYCSQRGAS